MDPRVKLFFKKTRWLWVAFFAWAIVSLLIFIGLNASFGGKHGDLAKVEMDYEASLKTRSLTCLNVSAEDIQVEVAMVRNQGDVVYGLYGEGYDNQELIVNNNDGVVSIVYPSGQKIAPSDEKNPLTLRVLIPQSRLSEAEMNIKNGDLTIKRIRANHLQLEQVNGEAYIDKATVRNMILNGHESDFYLKNAYTTRGDIYNTGGNIDLEDNRIRSLFAQTNHGGITVYNTSIRGNWTLKSTHDVMVMTRSTPWNLLLDAKTGGPGKVHMNWQNRTWRKADKGLQTEREYQASVGFDPRNSLVINSANGDITVQKRGRYDENPIADHENLR